MKVFEKSQNSSRKVVFFVGFILFAYLTYSFIYKPLSSQNLSGKNNNISLLEKADKLNIFIFNKKANFKSKVKVQKNDTLEKLLLVQKINKQEVAKVWVAASIFTFSFASIAWCRPSEYLLPGNARPVCSSTIMIFPSSLII